MSLTAFPLRKKRFYALTGDSRTSVLAEVIKAPKGTPSLRVISRTESGLDNEATVSKLLAAANGALVGEISVALPLHFFEIVTITLPSMAEEAVRKALPYHLAKTIDKPLQSCVYDWQITHRRKNHLQITVYLLPVETFQRLHQNFFKKQLVIKYLEADVFAAFAFLDKNGRLAPEEATLCALIWPDSLSFAVYEHKKMTLVRSVEIKQPATPFISMTESVSADDKAEARENLVPAPEGISPEAAKSLQDGAPAAPVEREALSMAEQQGVGILADFDLISSSSTSAGVDRIITEPGNVTGDWDGIESTAMHSDFSPPASAMTWPDYLQTINLEIMRTRDYYASVVKGGVIKNMVVGGAETFWTELAELALHSLEVALTQLGPLSQTPDASPLQNVVCLGTGTRW